MEFKTIVRVCRGRRMNRDIPALLPEEGLVTQAARGAARESTPRLGPRTLRKIKVAP
jgi:hypothetical protein